MGSYKLPHDLEIYLKKTLPDILKEHHIPGASLAIVKDGEIVYQNGFGYKDYEDKSPVDTQTLFAIGSTSKAFTAVVLGKLVDEGKLDWDDLVIDYIPEFRMKDPVATAQMNIKDILCHRCGMSRHDLGWFFAENTRSELLKKIQYLEPFAPFRSAFFYNNWMWMVAGIVTERITGKTWEENIQEMIFEPLGMKEATCSAEGMLKAANHSEPYDMVNDQITRIPFHNINAIGPAGSINAHIEDYAKWLLMNVNQGEFNGKQIVSKENLGEIFNPQMAIDKDNDLVKGITKNKEFSNLVYTLGWVSQHYRGHQMLQHAGGIDGFSAFISILPDDNLGVAILTNQITSIHYGITWEITDRLLGLEPIDWIGRVAEYENEVKKMGEEEGKNMLAMKVKDTNPSHSLESYCGEFYHPGYGTLKVELKDGKLAGFYNHIAITVEHFHYDVFLAHFEIPSPQVNIPLSFTADLMGNISKVLIPMDGNVPEIEFTKLD